MTLLLNGEQIIGNRMKVTANLKIESDDMSGQTSNTEKSHKGFKPKTLTVALTIPYKQLSNLRTLMRLAEGTEGGGQLRPSRADRLLREHRLPPPHHRRPRAVGAAVR